MFIVLLVSSAQNNHFTRHLTKVLIHLSWCLEECMSTPEVPSRAIVKALNAVYISSIFLKYLIENAKSDSFDDLYLSLDQSEVLPSNFSTGKSPFAIPKLFPEYKLKLFLRAI